MTASAFARVAILLYIGALQQSAWSQPSTSAQSHPSAGVSKSEFEVASVKPCDPHVARGPNAGGVNRGGVAFNCIPLIQYIRFSYGAMAVENLTRQVAPLRVEGGPAWINSELYQITAKAGGQQNGSGNIGNTGAMMRTLLESRFKLKVHRETRQEPAYALVVARGGLLLSKAKACIDYSPATPVRQRCGARELTSRGFLVVSSTMADFCFNLSTRIPVNLDHRMIVDKTAIHGVFDFDLKFTPPDSDVGTGSATPAFDTGEDFERLQGALRGVGLQLVPATAPVEIMIVDHAERPLAN